MITYIGHNSKSISLGFHIQRQNKVSFPNISSIIVNVNKPETNNVPHNCDPTLNKHLCEISMFGNDRIESRYVLCDSQIRRMFNCINNSNCWMAMWRLLKKYPVNSRWCTISKLNSIIKPKYALSILQAVILVFLKSSSGRIPAGSATIPIRSDRDHQQSKVGIEKCPDKTANIEYSIKLTKIKE